MSFGSWFGRLRRMLNQFSNARHWYWKLFAVSVCRVDTCAMTRAIRNTIIWRIVTGRTGCEAATGTRPHREMILRGLSHQSIDIHPHRTVRIYCWYWMHSAELWDRQVALLLSMCRGRNWKDYWHCDECRSASLEFAWWLRVCVCVRVYVCVCVNLKMWFKHVLLFRQRELLKRYSFIEKNVKIEREDLFMFREIQYDIFLHNKKYNMKNRINRGDFVGTTSFRHSVILQVKSECNKNWKNCCINLHHLSFKFDGSLWRYSGVCEFISHTAFFLRRFLYLVQLNKRNWTNV